MRTIFKKGDTVLISPEVTHQIERHTLTCEILWSNMALFGYKVVLMSQETKICLFCLIYLKNFLRQNEFQSLSEIFELLK